LARDWHTAGSSEITVIGIDRPTLDKDIQKIVGQFDWELIACFKFLINVRYNLAS
jgi:hypothetical protein